MGSWLFHIRNGAIMTFQCWFLLIKSRCFSSYFNYTSFNGKELIFDGLYRSSFMLSWPLSSLDPGVSSIIVKVRDGWFQRKNQPVHWLPRPFSAVRIFWKVLIWDTNTHMLCYHSHRFCPHEISPDPLDIESSSLAHFRLLNNSFPFSPA